jgi:hypothetical protein
MVRVWSRDEKIQIWDLEWKNPDPGSTCGVSKTSVYNQDPAPHLAGLDLGTCNIRIQNNSSHQGKVRKAIRFIVLNVQK